MRGLQRFAAAECRIGNTGISHLLRHDERFSRGQLVLPGFIRS
jgi:hypothetical protein